MPAARFPSWAKAALVAALASAYAVGGHAALFEDEEARRAILELRQRFDALQQSNQRSGERSGEEVSQLRRSLLDLQTQIEALRTEQASLRGQNEQLQREVAELQRRQKDIAQGVDERLRKFEPLAVTVDGREFRADPAEKREFEAALAVFRSGKFPEAATAFGSFMRQYPQSGYLPSARFWLGNAQYATRDYKEAINNFKSLLVLKAQVGAEKGRWKPVYMDFVKVWMATVAVFILCVVGFSALIGILAGSSIALVASQSNRLGLWMFVVIIVSIIAGIFMLILASAPARAYREARMFQLMWNNIGVSHVARFKCHLKSGQYLWLRIKNMLLTLLTLGLYRPFARVSEYRMKCESVTLHVKGGVEQVTGAMVRQQQGGLGDALADAAGLDLIG